MTKRIIFSILVIFFFQNVVAQDFWQQTNGPYSGTLTEMAVDTCGHVFGLKGNYGSQRIFQSNSDLSEWFQTGYGFPQNISIYDIAINNNNHIFLGTNDGVYISKNHGNSFQPINNGLENKSIYCFAFDINSNIFAGGNGVFRSSDNGNTWIAVISGLIDPLHLNNYIYSLVFDKNGRLFAGSNDYGIYFSENSGNNWTHSTAPRLKVNALVVSESNFIFAAIGDEGIYRSMNHGLSWHQLGNGLPLRKFKAIVCSKNNFIYAGGFPAGVYRSADNGEQWLQLFNGMIPYGINNLKVRESGEIIAATYAIYLSADDGNNWQIKSKGLGFADVEYIEQDPNSESFYAVTKHEGVFRSEDKGENWISISNGIKSYYLGDIAINDSGHVFLASNDGVYRTKNEGYEWQLINEGADNPIIWLLMFNDTGVLYGGANNGVYISENNGEDWIMNADSSYWYIIRSMTLNDSGQIFVTAHLHYTPLFWSDGCLLRSLDDGATWAQLLYIDSPGPYDFVYMDDVRINQNDIIFITAYHPLIDNMMRSEDSGLNWTSIINGLPRYYIYDLELNSENHLFVSLEESGVYYSTDNGENWLSINSGLSHLNVLSIFFDKREFIYIGTEGGGVYKSTVSTVTDIRETNNILPESFKLYQNYPNPFNASTTISYFLQKTMNVTLEIYDITGRLVATLINEKQKRGKHDIIWDASGYSSNIYFCRLKANSISEVKKMILIR